MMPNKLHLGTSVAAVFALSILTGTAIAQSSAPSGASGAAGKAGSDVRVAVTQPTRALEELRIAVRNLREASVLLLNQKDQSGSRDKAVDAAQKAIADAQEAMVSLPAKFRISDSKTREAKDWPAAAARLDKAALALERTVDALEKQSGGNVSSGAIEAVHNAMDDVEAALLAIPDWTPGRS
jgi:hypothetical protein